MKVILTKTNRNVLQDNANHKTRSGINSTPRFLSKTQLNDSTIERLNSYIYFLIILATLPSARTIYTPAGR